MIKIKTIYVNKKYLKKYKDITFNVVLSNYISSEKKKKLSIYEEHTLEDPFKKSFKIRLTVSLNFTSGEPIHYTIYKSCNEKQTTFGWLTNKASKLSQNSLRDMSDEEKYKVKFELILEDFYFECNEGFKISIKTEKDMDELIEYIYNYNLNHDEKLKIVGNYNKICEDIITGRLTISNTIYVSKFDLSNI